MVVVVVVAPVDQRVPHLTAVVVEAGQRFLLPSVVVVVRIILRSTAVVVVVAVARADQRG